MLDSDDTPTKLYNADLVIWIYTLSSLIALMLAFEETLTPIKSTNCLVISWLFALGALGISVLYENTEAAEEQEVWRDY